MTLPPMSNDDSNISDPPPLTYGLTRHTSTVRHTTTYSNLLRPSQHRSSVHPHDALEAATEHVEKHADEIVERGEKKEKGMMGENGYDDEFTTKVPKPAHSYSHIGRMYEPAVKKKQHVRLMSNVADSKTQAAASTPTPPSLSTATASHASLTTGAATATATASPSTLASPRGGNPHGGFGFGSAPTNASSLLSSSASHSSLFRDSDGTTFLSPMQSHVSSQIDLHSQQMTAARRNKMNSSTAATSDSSATTGAGSKSNSEHTTVAKSSASTSATRPRSHRTQRLALFAAQRDRAAYMALRPQNPFLNPTSSSYSGASSVSAIQSRNILRGSDTSAQSELNSSVFSAQKQAARSILQAEYIRQRTEEDREKVGEVTKRDDDSLLTSTRDPLLISGVDPSLYAPSSSNFSTTTRALLHNPFYSQPSPSDSAVYDVTGGVTTEGQVQSNPTLYLRRDHTSQISRELIQRIRKKVEGNVKESWRRNMRGREEEDGNVNNTTTTNDKTTSTVTNTTNNPQAHLTQSTSSAFQLLLSELNASQQVGGVESIKNSTTGGGGGGGGGAAEASSSTSSLLQSALSHVPRTHRAHHKSRGSGNNLTLLSNNDTSEYHQMEYRQMVGNMNSASNLLQGVNMMHLHGGGGGMKSPNSSSSHTSTPPQQYSFRLTFRTHIRHLNCTSTDIHTFMSGVPGVTEVQDVTMTPGGDAAMITFWWCGGNNWKEELSKTDPLLSARSLTSNTASTIEHDGLSAVRAHLRSICSEAMTPYMPIHVARSDVVSSKWRMDPNSNIEGSDSLTAASANDLRTTLRFILNKAVITESSAVQIEAMKEKWKKNGGRSVGVGLHETSLPNHSLHKQEESKSPSTSSHNNANGKQNDEDEEPQSLMSRDLSHMFTPRSGQNVSASVTLTSNASSANLNSARMQNGGGSATRKKVATSALLKPKRTNAVYTVPALSWPEGLFNHVNASSSSSDTRPTSSFSEPMPPLPSNFLGSSHHAGSLSSRQAVSAVIGAKTVSGTIGPQTQRSVAMPTGTYAGSPPSSLAEREVAPPPHSSSRSFRLLTDGSTSTRSRQHDQTHEPSIYSAHPSSRGTARTHDPSVYVIPRGESKFFRNDGDDENTSASPASDLDRILSAQQSSKREEESKTQHRRRSATRHTPVRSATGRVPTYASERSKQAKMKAEEKRVAKNLTWTLTAQLEAY